MTAEGKNFEAITKAKADHNARCPFPPHTVRMNPFEIERMQWEEGDTIAGLVLEGDPKVGTGAFRLVCDGMEPPELEIEEVEAISAPVEPLEVPVGPGRPGEPTRPNLRRRPSDRQLTIERACEEVGLAPGGPARDAVVALGVEVEADRAVLDGDVGRAHELVARALEILGQP